MGVLRVSRSVKFAPDSSDTLDILAIPFGGIFKGKDFDGEYFSSRTDLCLDFFPQSRPLLYEHGFDAKTGLSVIGRVDSTTLRKTDEGWWVQAQLDKSSAYYGLIKELIGHDILHGSSGAVGHLTKKAPSGEILRWPWFEESLTPQPSNLFSRVNPVTAAKHYRAAGIPLDVDDWLAKADQLSANWATGDRTGQKVGRVLSGTNEARIRHALADLQAVVDGLGKTG